MYKNKFSWTWLFTTVLQLFVEMFYDNLQHFTLFWVSVIQSTRTMYKRELFKMWQSYWDKMTEWINTKKDNIT